FAKVARVQRSRSGAAQLGWDGIQGRLDLVLIGRVVRERVAHDQQAVLIDRDLGVIVLLEAFRAALFHNPRLGIGEVVLVLVAGTRRWWLGRSAARGAPGPLGFLRPFLHLGVIPGLLDRLAFYGPRFQHGFGFGQPSEARLPDGNF